MISCYYGDSLGQWRSRQCIGHPFKWEAPWILSGLGFDGLGMRLQVKWYCECHVAARRQAVQSHLLLIDVDFVDICYCVEQRFHTVFDC